MAGLPLECLISTEDGQGIYMTVSTFVQANKSKPSDVLRLCEACQGSLGPGRSGPGSCSIAGQDAGPGLGSWAGAGLRVPGGAGQGQPPPDTANPSTNRLESPRSFQWSSRM